MMMPYPPKLYLDSEAAGLHSMPVMFQFAIGEDGPVVIYDIWTKPISETLALIELFVRHFGKLPGTLCQSMVTHR
jgi:hypothetical protein